VGNRVEDVAHQHEEGCCGGAHARLPTTGDRDGIPENTEGAAR
jgi:hypothetical protein